MAVQDSSAPTQIRPVTWIGRTWARAVKRNAVARIVDCWWYNMDDGPVALICTLGEVGCVTIGTGLLGVPFIIAANVGRFWVTLPEVHTTGVFLRRGLINYEWNFDIVNRPQTFHRDESGALVQSLAGHTARLNRLPLSGSPAKKVGQFIVRTTSDLVTQRRKLPGFIAGTLSPIAAVLLKTSLHAPLGVALGVTYLLFGLQAAPMVRSGLRAAAFVLKNGRRLGWKNALKEGYQIFGRPEEHAGIDPAGRLSAPEVTAIAEMPAPAEAPAMAQKRIRPVRIDERSRGLGKRPPREPVLRPVAKVETRRPATQHATHKAHSLKTVNARHKLNVHRHAKENGSRRASPRGMSGL